ALRRSPADQGNRGGRRPVQGGFLRVRDNLPSKLDLVHPLLHHPDPEVSCLRDVAVLIMLISSSPEYATLQTRSSSRRDSKFRKLVSLVVRLFARSSSWTRSP